jgi:hypothetical protein
MGGLVANNSGIPFSTPRILPHYIVSVNCRGGRRSVIGNRSLCNERRGCGRQELIIKDKVFTGLKFEEHLYGI